jgi:L-ascorbate metabolism protein UlaG (beta-lactamase superfamily)
VPVLDDELAETERLQRLSWLGHSTVLFELDGVRLLTDPVVRPRVLHLSRVGAAPRLDSLSLDAVLISHVHYDHLDIPSLRGLAGSPPVVVPRGVGALLRKHGFEHVIEVEPGDEAQIGRVTVRATHAEHTSRRRPFGAVTPALGYLVSGSVCSYFAGDTDLFGGMGGIADDLDVALLPVAGWGPKLPPGHLDPRKAAEALGMLRPRIAVPIHWGTYRRIGLSRDPDVLREPALRFASFAADLMPDVEVLVLPVGGSVELDLRTAFQRRKREG